MTARIFQRPGYSALELYSPAVQCAVDLSDNTNLWGPAPSALAAIRATDERVARYPSSYSANLVRAFSGYLSVPEQCIVTGCGSDDILDSAIRAFVEPGESVAMCDPTFSMMSVFATLNGAKPVKIAFLESGAPDIERLVLSGARVLYLCSPNNPTGSVIPREQIDEIRNRFDGIVILDEAYSEFSGDSLAARAAVCENLIVTRTMSKAFGLAGIRVGCSVSSPALAAEISKSRGPYKIAVASEAAAVAALDNDVEWMRSCVAQAETNREKLKGRLTELGYSALPSRANFLMIPVTDAKKVGDSLAESGVSVRAFRGLSGIGDAIRVTIGPDAMMQQFLTAFEQAVA